jgi:cell division septal protein FtsQ
VKEMADTKKKKKPTQEEKEIRTYNPTKSKAGRIILLILAIGMFLGLLIAAVVGAIEVLNGFIA